MLFGDLGVEYCDLGDVVGKGIERDLLVHLDDGTQINVEMQAKGKAAFRWART